jgi:hypothetical protein
MGADRVRDSRASVNPKDVLAAKTKVPVHLLPAVGRIYGALACRDGAEKYGPYNWREEAISLMGYTGAMERHILAIRDGEDIAPDSLCEHLGHIIATASILLDARECNMLIDDRPAPGAAPRLLNPPGTRPKGGAVCPSPTCPGRGPKGELCEDCPRREVPHCELECEA